MKLLVEKLILILAIFGSASGAFAATAARGLVLWRQPPADAVSALEFVTVTRSNVAFSSVLLPTGERLEIPRGGVVAFIDYPSETPTVSEAEAAIRNLEAAIPKYPFCTARLRAALTKWNNALAFSRQLSRKPVATPAKAASVPALLVDGVKYAEATLSSFDGATVGIEHANGVAKIAAKQLMPPQITALNATSTSVRIDLTRIASPSAPSRALPIVSGKPGVTLALQTPLDFLFRLHASEASLADWLVAFGYLKNEFTGDDGITRHHFRNDRLDVEVSITGEDEVSSVTIGQQLGMRGNEGAAEGHSYINGFMNFVIPSAGTWYIDSLRTTLRTPDMTPKKLPKLSKAFGRHRVDIEFTASTNADGISGITVTITRDSLGKAPIPEREDALASLLLDSRISEREKALKGTRQEGLSLRSLSISVPVAGENTEERRRISKVSYYSWNRVTFSLQKDEREVGFRKEPFSGHITSYYFWKKVAEIEFTVEISELPQLIAAFDGVEELKSASKRKEFVGLSKPLGNVGVNPAFFVTPETLDLGGLILMPSDVFRLRLLAAALPDLKAKIENRFAEAEVMK